MGNLTEELKKILTIRRGA